MIEIAIACAFIGMVGFGLKGAYWTYQFNLLLESKHPDKADDFRIPYFFVNGFVALLKYKEAEKSGDVELKKVANKCYFSYIYGWICALLIVIFVFFV